MILSKLQHGLAVFAASNPIRPQLTTVLTDSVVSVATDSLRLVEIKAHEGTATEQVTINAREIKKVKLSDLGFHDFTGNPHLVSEYPKYQTIFDEAMKRDSVEFTLDAHYLAKIAAYLAKIESKDKRGTFITVRVPKEKDRPIVFTVKGATHDARAILMPIDSRRV